MTQPHYTGAMGITSETVETVTPAPFVKGRGLPLWFVYFVQAIALALFTAGAVMAFLSDPLVPAAFASVGATWAVANWLAFFVPFAAVPAEADTTAVPTT